MFQSVDTEATHPLTAPRTTALPYLALHAIPCWTYGELRNSIYLQEVEGESENQDELECTLRNVTHSYRLCASLDVRQHTIGPLYELRPSG